MQSARAHANPHAPRKCNVLQVQERLSDLSRYHGGGAVPDAGRAPITWFSDTVPTALCGRVHAHSATHMLHSLRGGTMIASARTDSREWLRTCGRGG